MNIRCGNYFYTLICEGEDSHGYHTLVVGWLNILDGRNCGWYRRSAGYESHSGARCTMSARPDGQCWEIVLC